VCKLFDILCISSYRKKTSITTDITRINAEERPRNTKARQQKHTLVDKETTTSTLRSIEETLHRGRKASDGRQQDPVEILQT